MSPENSLSVCIPDADEAIEKLERALFEFQCLLDYVASHHPQKLTAEYLEDLQAAISDDLDTMASKYGLPRP